jgi:hypothetical protein
VVGVSFPAGRRWARIDLPGDEYIPWTPCGRCWRATARTPQTSKNNVPTLVGEYER